MNKNGWLFDDNIDEEVNSEKRSYNRSDSKPKTIEKIGVNSEFPLSVSQLNQWIKNTLDRTLYPVWLEAEISDLSSPSSGHFYMTLKDSESQIRGVLWRSSASRLGFRLEDGLAVLCYGNLDVYSPRGTYQFIVQKVQPKGIGSLQLAFQQLHAKLAKEGLFDPLRKKKLPRFPKRIGFVTSPTGAAVHDFLEVLRRRWQGVQVIIIPSKVQGEGSVEEIVRGIRVAGRIQPPLDLLVVGRGGGSLEDLWSFNDERVVRALAESPLPTVSAVGHEIDVTLADLVADVRALTPSEAAERILPDAQELMQALQKTHARLEQWIEQYTLQLRRRIEQIQSRPVLQQPESMLRPLAQRIDELQVRLDQGIDRSMDKHRLRLEQAAATLEALSPLRVLARGYSMTRKEGDRILLTNAESLKQGDVLETTLHQGMVRSKVL